MKPADRQYDADLVRSARDAAKWVRKRSGKIALILTQLADRVTQLSNAAAIESVPQTDLHGEAIPGTELSVPSPTIPVEIQEIQPASPPGS